VYRKKVTDLSSEPADYSWVTSAATQKMAGAIVVVRNADADDPVDASATANTASGATQSSHASPVVTSTDDHRLILLVYYVAAGTTYTMPSGTSERVDVASADHTVAIADVQKLAAGTSPAFTATSGAAGRACLMAIALSPALQLEAVA
jgi:hypothetical protein